MNIFLHTWIDATKATLAVADAFLALATTLFVGATLFQTLSGQFFLGLPGAVAIWRKEKSALDS